MLSRSWGVGVLVSASMVVGCLDGAKEEAPALVQSPPVEQSEAEADAQATGEPAADEDAKKPADADKADQQAAPKVKVTLGEGSGKKAKLRMVPAPPPPPLKAAPSRAGERDNAVPQAATAAGGKLSEDDVRKVAEAHLDELGSCYVHESGDEVIHLEVRLTVGPLGHVQAASVGVENGPETMKECVEEIVKSWEFPPPQGGGVVKVRYPFTLQPTG